MTTTITRLRDGVAQGARADEQVAARLLATAEPHPRSNERHFRVWQSVQNTVAAPPRRLWRPALATAALLLAGTASAAVWMGSRDRELRLPRTQETAPSPKAAPLFVGVPDDTPSPAPPHRPRALHRVHSPEVEVQAETEGARLMLDAVRALRRQGDAATASKLARTYLRKFPNGPLAEECLALEAEAAASLGASNAVALARQYLKRYPNGRFREKLETLAKQPSGR
ncbi:MAG: hypothetical protein SGI86_12480 [Deltaproteobacteria bacterium]|nr:hypothetical protein [Deltaproteobacteria bacterium]